MSFSITLPDAQPRTYTRLGDARKYAEKVAVRDQLEVEVVDMETGVVALVTSAAEIAKRTVGAHFHPWTRLETPKHPAPHFEGWYPAYTRKRIQATVYRSYDEANELPWRVFDGRTGGHLDVASTKAACALTREMRLGRTL